MNQTTHRLQIGCLVLAALAATQPCGAQQGSAVAAPQTPAKQISWKLLVPNLVRDQKELWRFPVDAARGRHVKSTLVVAGVTAGLVALDPLVASGFRGSRSFDGFNRAFSGRNTWLGEEGVLPAVFLAGVIRKDNYMRQTALLGAEAFFGANVLSLTMEDATHRLLPSQVPANADFSDTWFNYSKPGSYLRGAGGFPSGHTISAFALATVIADRYPNPRWHRWVAYGLASAVSFSRLSVHSHFSSDVFLGAALGYAIPHYIVLRRFRPTKATQGAPKP